MRRTPPGATKASRLGHPGSDALPGCASRGLGYLLAVSRDDLVPLDGGKTRQRADRIAAGLPATEWSRRSAGAGSKGPRFYD